MDAMKKGGTLTIETNLVTLDEFIEAGGFGITGQYAVLSVTDTGDGMDETTKECSIPFYYKGSGERDGPRPFHCLWHSETARRLHNRGERANVGTSFHIYFPTVDTKIVDEDEPSQAVLKGGNETILVAEDDESVRRFLVEVLGLYGYRVLQAVDGEDAVRKFAVNTGIDLLIFDSVMPRQERKGGI